MTYSSGGLIQATDYNTMATTLNGAWSTGTGNKGYGQTAVASVTSVTDTVTATQWATLISRLNSALTHQAGAGSGVTAPTAGTTIAYLSTLSTNVTTANTNAVNFASQGTTTAGTATNASWVQANTTSAVSTVITRTATFASADQARYFFNAGGQLNFVLGTAVNNDASGRSGSIVTLCNTNFAAVNAFRQGSNGGRSGTGGTLNTNATTIGYYGLTTTNQTLVSVTGTTAAYTADTIVLAVKSNGTQGANGDKGTVITFTLTITSAAQGGINDTINVTIPHRVDVVYPETTNLTNTWGTVTIA